MTVADDMLSRKITDSIKKLDDSKGQPCTPTAHDAVVDGVKCLLELKQHELNNPQVCQNNSSNITLLGGRLLALSGVNITGRDVIMLLIVVAMFVSSVKGNIAEWIKAYRDTPMEQVSNK